MNSPYRCPNCKTNRSRFNIIQQVPQSIKMDPQTGNVLEEYSSEQLSPSICLIKALIKGCNVRLADLWKTSGHSSNLAKNNKTNKGLRFYSQAFICSLTYFPLRIFYYPLSMDLPVKNAQDRCCPENAVCRGFYKPIRFHRHLHTQLICQILCRKDGHRT